MTKEKLTAFYHSVYNTCVEYYGERREVLDFLGYFDIWGCHGQRIENEGKPLYRFEMTKEFFDYMHTDDFKRIMNQRFNIEVILTN